MASQSPNPGTAIRPIDQFKTELKLMEPNFIPLLPANVPVEKFKAMVIAAVGGNPKLLECTRASLWRACIQGAELGLSLNPTTAEADILPVWSKANGNEAQFRPRYKGLMNLARRSGEVLTISATLVHENDRFEVIEGLRPNIIHVRANGDRGALTHAYCVWTLKGVPEPQFEVMDCAQIMKIKARTTSKKADGTIVGPWVNDEEEMWRKTVVKRATKYMPISVEILAKAVAVDNLHETGVDFDITDGEVITETDWEPVPDYDDTTQVEDLADEIAQETEDFAVPMVDIQNAESYKQWAIRAAAAVKAIPVEYRQKWATLHTALLDEAEVSEPKLVARLRVLIEGGE
jgi:recombination protein RecT